MSIHNFKFIRGLLTASIVLVFLIDKSLQRNIRSTDRDQSDLQQNLHPANLSLRTPHQLMSSLNESKQLINGTDCDCNLYGIYCYAKTNECYSPYTQGPCENHQHLVLPENKNKLECVDNPCGDYELPYNGSCYHLWNDGPCGPDGHLAFSDESRKLSCTCFFNGFRYLDSEKCYKPYMKGPCKTGQHLVLQENQKQLECVDNPCEDDKVPFEGSCYSWDNGPCGEGGYFMLSSDSHEPTCYCYQPFHFPSVKSKACYKPYTQGPCEEGEYLVLPEHKDEMECVRNPCGDNKVPYNGSCYSLNDSKGVCGPNATFDISFESHKPDCNCWYGQLHHMETNGCYKPYTQGPCENGNYVVVPENGTELECVVNPCSDNEVPYNGSCYSLDDTKGPCDSYQFFVISSIDHKPACVARPAYSVVNIPLLPCPEGYQRSGTESECRRKF